MEIDETRAYTARQIARNGWILNYAGSKSHNFVAKLIKDGLLRANKRSPRGWYRVAGAEIKRYLRENEGVKIQLSTGLMFTNV